MNYMASNLVSPQPLLGAGIVYSLLSTDMCISDVERWVTVGRCVETKWWSH